MSRPRVRDDKLLVEVLSDLSFIAIMAVFVITAGLFSPLMLIVDNTVEGAMVNAGITSAIIGMAGAFIGKFASNWIKAHLEG